MARIELRALRPLIVAGPSNRTVLRLLVPDVCRFACGHCPFGALANAALADGSPGLTLDRIARLAVTAYRRGWCDGVFLTAGAPLDPVAAMDRLLLLVELLRITHGYRGYLHVRAVAGAAPGQVERLVHLVDRVSSNMEVACARALHENAGLEPPAVRQLEMLNAAEVQRARVASARSSPSFVPVSFPVASTGHGGRGTPDESWNQGMLFEATKDSARGVYARRIEPAHELETRVCA